jgi:hypothetical protein
MSILINTCSDRELLDIYANSCRAIEIAKRTGRNITATDGESIPLDQLQKDNDMILREVTYRLPVSYKWEIEKLTHGQPDYKVAGGDRYRHTLVHALVLQVVERDGSEHSCRLFVLGKYCCRIIIKESTLLKHFTKI